MRIKCNGPCGRYRNVRPGSMERNGTTVETYVCRDCLLKDMVTVSKRGRKDNRAYNKIKEFARLRREIRGI